jgi:hypothetical protein
MLQRPSETEAWLRRTSEDLKDRAKPSFYRTTPGTPRSAAKRHAETARPVVAEVGCDDDAATGSRSECENSGRRRAPTRHRIAGRLFDAIQVDVYRRPGVSREHWLNEAAECTE